MSGTKTSAKKSTAICVNANEETLKILAAVKNKSQFIREAIKDKFLYERFREEHANLKNDLEKTRSENERLKQMVNNYKEKIKEKTKINEELERGRGENKTLREELEKRVLKDRVPEKEKGVQNRKMYREKSESNIINAAKEIYNKYKKHRNSAIKITEKYLQKRGITDTSKIIEQIIKDCK